MNSLSWKSIGEALGLAAIVGSLLFVGFQLRQEQRIAVAEIGQSSIDSQIEIDALIAAHAEVWARNNAGESLSETETLIIRRIIYSLYNKRRTEAGIRRSMGQAGVVPGRLFASFLIDNPGAYRIWLSTSEQEARRMSRFEDFPLIQDFRAEIVDILSTLDEPREVQK